MIMSLYYARLTINGRGEDALQGRGASWGMGPFVRAGNGSIVWFSPVYFIHFLLVILAIMGGLDNKGMVKLILGDCLEVMKTLPDKSVDAVITDPPYSTQTVASFGRKIVKRLSDLAIQEFYFSAIKQEWERILKPSAPVFVFCDDAYYPVLFALFYSWHQTNLLIWDKGKIGMGNPFRRQHELIFYANRESIILADDVSYIPTIIKEALHKEYHAAEKPVAIIKRLIAGLVPCDSVILDPFMGSGTTGVACVQAGRDFIGIEIDPEYFAIAERRIKEAQAQGKLFP